MTLICLPISKRSFDLQLAMGVLQVTSVHYVSYILHALITLCRTKSSNETRDFFIYFFFFIIILLFTFHRI